MMRFNLFKDDLQYTKCDTHAIYNLQYTIYKNETYFLNRVCSEIYVSRSMFRVFPFLNIFLEFPRSLETFSLHLSKLYNKLL